MLREILSVTASSNNVLAITRITVITGFSTRTSYSSIAKTELLSSDLARPSTVRFTRAVAKDSADKDLECIWDEIDEAIHRLGLPDDGTLTVEHGEGKKVIAFDKVEDV